MAAHMDAAMRPTDSRPTQLTTFDRLYGVAAGGAFGALWLTACALWARPDELYARAGWLPAAEQPLLWLHGASAGEMAAAVKLAEILHASGVHFTAAYTTTNRAGLDFITRAAAPGSLTAFVPWDAPRWVGRALDRWRPLALVLVETELWPRLILEACRRNVPVFCASARIYPRDVARYRAIRPLLATTLSRLTAVLAQNERERSRFLSLGVPAERCFVGGNLKHVGINSASAPASAFAKEIGVGADEPVVVVGSIHADEMPLVTAAIGAVDIPKVRWIIAPRQRSGADTILKAAAAQGWRVVLRSHPSCGDWRVLVLDTMGELTRAYAMASVAVVGGGFGKHGGHNLLEPVMYGVPVMFGPRNAHFESDAQRLIDATPEAQVSDGTQLAQRLTHWLGHEMQRRDVLARQTRALPDGPAIARCYVEALSPWLKGSEA